MRRTTVEMGKGRNLFFISLDFLDFSQRCGKYFSKFESMEFAETSRQNEPSNHLLTIKDAAEYCDVSVRTVKRWINSEKLPAFNLPSGNGARPIVRIEFSKLTKWLKGHLVNSAEATKKEPKPLGKRIKLNGRKFID